MAESTVREAVSVFHDETSLQAAVDALLIAGFDRSQLSLLAGQRHVETRLGHRVDQVAELEDDPEVPTRAYVGIDSRTEAKAAIVGGLVYVGAIVALGAIVASGGTAADALIAGAIGGAVGGLLGIIVARQLQQRHVRRLQEQLDRGGLLLWVRTPTPDAEARAMATLKAHGGEDVHLHDLPEQHYERGGGVSRDLSFMQTIGM